MDMQRLKSMIYFFILCVIILQHDIATTGMREGIELCINSVIPALYPFLVITPMINGAIPPIMYAWIKPLRKICGIPMGGESIFLLGMLSGYPNGARMITDARKNGQLDKYTASRMLGYCSNAGPAFLFGICGNLLPAHAVWMLWAIHIISALITAALLPRQQSSVVEIKWIKKMRITDSIIHASKTMLLICAWILVFRTISAFITKWMSNIISPAIYEVINAALELTTGILLMDQKHTLGYRFIFTASNLAFGGLCVAAQTISVTKGLGSGYYFPGKIIQTAISFLFAYILQFIIFPSAQLFIIPLYIHLFVFLILICILIYLHKKTVAFADNMMYNAIEI